MEKRKEIPESVTLNSDQLLEFCKQLFKCNCPDKETVENMNGLLKSDPKFAIMLLNVLQRTYSQGMRHGAALTAYGNNYSEIKYKILEETGYNEGVFEGFWIISKKYLTDI